MTAHTTTEAPVNPEFPEITQRTGSEIIEYRAALNSTRRSLAQLEAGVAHYPEPIRGATNWLQGFFLDHCRNNLDALREIACKVGVDRSREYYNNIVTGQYFRSVPTTWQKGGRAWSEYLELIEALRRYDQQAAQVGRLPFVHTPTYKCIADFIAQARALEAVCKWGGICGPTGSQKSESLKFYARLNNHGSVIHVEADRRYPLTRLQHDIAKAYSVGNYAIRGAASRVDAILENVNETRTIIVDNVQRLFDASKGGRQDCFDWLLKLQDDTRCTLILSFTTDFVDVLGAGRAKGYFEQFLGRMGGMSALLKLPDFAPVADLRCIARAFGLKPGKDVMEHLHRWSRQDGRIRIVFSRLQRARTFAELDGRKHITLGDLAEAESYVPPSIGSDDDEEGGAE